MTTKKTINTNKQDIADAKEWIAKFNEAQFLQDGLYNTLEAMTFRWMSEGA